jgi:hypothetical protein
MPVVAVRDRPNQIARPLKTLVPLIKEELDAGNSAGLEHYRRAGGMLLEAREQLSGGSWTAWLTRNFRLSKMTASRYMRLAERVERGERIAGDTLHEAIGERHTRTPLLGDRPFRIPTAHVDVERLTQERQTVADEVKLHRDLALELIDIGFKALATRLHPDKGGSRDAMGRLNRVRAELRDVATTRRFV